MYTLLLKRYKSDDVEGEYQNYIVSAVIQIKSNKILLFTDSYFSFSGSTRTVEVRNGWFLWRRTALLSR